ncbi:MAG TPA: hypothetical protein VMW05_09810 [Methyloceanibacter sp.]|nr:hypothetical protein [Methyloceanibacter sp.]
MRAGLAILAAFSVYALACAPAAAACYGTNSKTKQRQAVHEIYGGTHPKRYFAQATHDPGTGRPQIIYYSRYSAVPAYFKGFVRHHECCHHLGNSNEIAANCCALRRMNLSSSGLAALRRYIVSRDVNSQTKVDYHGQGSAFWSKTASRCLG